MCAGICCDRHLRDKRDGAAEGFQLRLDDLLAGLHQLRIQRVVPPDCYGEVPAMDQHVQETVPSIDRAGTTASSPRALCWPGRRGLAHSGIWLR